MSRFWEAKRRREARARALQVRHALAYALIPGYAGTYVSTLILAELSHDQATIEWLRPMDSWRLKIESGLRP